MKPLGLFGGTFDPVHFGHLRPLIDLRDALPFEAIRVLPCHRPPHRARPHAASEDRAEMLRLALEDVDGLVLDAREMQRRRPSYSVETLESFRAELPQTPLCWILGHDAFAGIHRWHRWRELLGLAHLVVCDRPDSPPLGGEPARLLREHGVDSPWPLTEAPAGCILRWPVTQLDISATRIRQLAANGQDLRYLVPEPVRRYIERNAIYLRAEARAAALANS